MSERFGEQINPQKQFYTEYYKKETDDSPDDTRWSLACSFYDVLRRGALPNFKCLDIAAGTQKFELEFIRQFGDRKIATENGNQSIRDCLQFTTFDLAEIPGAFKEWLGGAVERGFPEPSFTSRREWDAF